MGGRIGRAGRQGIGRRYFPQRPHPTRHRSRHSRSIQSARKDPTQAANSTDSAIRSNASSVASGSTAPSQPDVTNSPNASYPWSISPPQVTGSNLSTPPSFASCMQSGYERLINTKMTFQKVGAMLEAQVWPIEQQLYVMELEVMREKIYENPAVVIYTLR